MNTKTDFPDHAAKQAEAVARLTRPRTPVAPLDFITILDKNTGRQSSLAIHGRCGNGTLTITGNLEHCAQIVPATVEDASKLIKWLTEWKASQSIPV